MEKNYLPTLFVDVITMIQSNKLVNTVSKLVSLE